MKHPGHAYSKYTGLVHFFQLLALHTKIFEFFTSKDTVSDVLADFHQEERKFRYQLSDQIRLMSILAMQLTG